MACTWLTMEEAAIYLKVHKHTIKSYIKRGLLKVNKPGGKLVRICLGELEKLGEPADE
ncbi:hypothetical protein LCGC14_1746980 [marine sediment metagenome]|uniref:Helix-turn-helix domain-containing protein n=1 Tax=marine sediment metagenome TaxID=412755 RepID=A0A0F9H4Z4_9ZZZZ